MKKNVRYVLILKKTHPHTPTYLPVRNPSPGAVPKEEKRKGTLGTFQFKKKNTTHLPSSPFQFEI